jgi:ribonuclease HI
MNSPTPHYLLLADANRAHRPGGWRFVLRPIDGSTALEVSDIEPDIWGERLGLLTVVRGLESLDQPSRVTLVGCSRYVEQGVLYGLAEWRENQWRWESFGQMVPVRDADLWQRMDRVLQFHRVDCGQRRIDASHDSIPAPHGRAHSRRTLAARFADHSCVKYRVAAVAGWCAVAIAAATHYLQTGVRTTSLLTSSLLLHRS